MTEGSTSAGGAGEDPFRREAILEAAGFAAEQLLRTPSWRSALPDVLARLGEGAAVSRSYVFRNVTDGDGRLLQDMIAEWCAPGIADTSWDPENHDLPYLPEYPHYVEELGSGKVMVMRRSEVTGVDLEDLDDEDIRSTVFLPIFVGDVWWGYLGFDDCETERQWAPPEVSALRVAAATLGAAIGRETLERARGEAELRYRLLIEQIPTVTYVEIARGPDEFPNPIEFISPQVQDLTGYAPEEFLLDRELWIRIVHPDDVEAYRNEDVAAELEARRYELEYRILTKEGRTVWVHDEAALLGGGHEEGDAVWHGVMYDVTQLRAALERERTATARLEQLDDMKNTFLNAVSHDLRTPVSAILGLALTLERDEGALHEDEKREFAGRIAANARKLNRIVADLLDMDRLARGVIALDRHPAPVDAIAVRVLEETEASASHPVTLEVQATVCSVDVGKVERMIENLVLNAVKHTPTGTPIHVRVRPEDGGVSIVVEDEGPGVPEAVRETIFEPFIQGSESRALGGVGVGLSVVQRFAELHGGRAWLEEREGGGASFRIFLPGEG